MLFGIFYCHGADVGEKGNLNTAGGGSSFGIGLERFGERGEGLWGNETTYTMGDGTGKGGLDDGMAEGVGDEDGADKCGSDHEVRID